MQRAGIFVALLAVLLGEFGGAQRVTAAPIDELVAAPRKKACSTCTPPLLSVPRVLKSWPRSLTTSIAIPGHPTRVCVL
jgi:hypothetical protein